jgi:hypothetical protein
MKNRQIFAVAVAAAAWFAITSAAFNSAGATTIIIKPKTSIVNRCDERREALSCRRFEKNLDQPSDRADDDGCSCGGASSAGSGARVGADQSSIPISGSPASAGGPGQASGGGAGTGDPGQGLLGGQSSVHGMLPLARFDPAPEPVSLTEQRWSETGLPRPLLN